MSQIKHALRADIKNILKAMSNENRRSQSEKIFRKLTELEWYKRSLKVGVFISMDEEVNTNLIIQDIFASGKECFIPWYNKDTMKMLKLDSWNDLISLPKTKWNISQPDDPELREEALMIGGLDLVVVPGLAFTDSGHRLGRGKGYYDRYLSKLREVSSNNGKEVKFVAVGFKEQIVHSIPMDSKDVLVDLVLYDNDVQ